MSDQEKEIHEKPAEIADLEKMYNIVLKQLPFDEKGILFLFDNSSYWVDAGGKVKALSITNNSIKDIAPIVRLKDLVNLNLSYNDIEDISQLVLHKKIKELYLHNNKIKDISVLAEFYDLERLVISGNPISDISPLSKLENLEELYCSENGINDLAFLKGMKRISAVYAFNNKIWDISPIISLHKITIDLGENLIKSIPKEVAQKYNWLNGSLGVRLLNHKHNFLIANNPLEFPPASVIELGPDTTKKYYEDAEQFGHAPLSEGRIIFVGDGSSGKSSIVEKILYNSFTFGREQTNGIKIEHLYLAHPEDGRKLSFHIWDFGGQEIQHAVHKFFFTEGCLYVVVLDNRKEEEPEYWLQQIESLGGGAPVLVVFNKQDENAVETTDRKYLKEKYPNIVGFYNTSCKTGFGIDDFKKSLQAEMVKLRTVSEQFPNNWLAIKKAIEENTSGLQHYLTYEAYLEICKQNHLVTEQAQQLLLKYFNTIGTVTWFGGDAFLKFLHVLNPAWITQGVYKILTAKKTANLFGQIRVNDFKEMLQPVNKEDYTYDEKHYGYILSMMKKFSLCYTSDDTNLLIPSAFGKVPKVEYSDFKGEEIRTYILQFKDYMPLALIHRFTAQKMPEALDNNYWYTGIVIKDSITNTLAMIHADKEAKRIYVRIKGESKLGIWEHVRRDFVTIASSYARIPYDELVQLDEKSGSTVNYQDVVSHIKAQKDLYFHPRLQKDFNVGYLMNLFEPRENTTDKIVRGEIALKDREGNIVPAKVPSYVINILNNNNPVVNTQVNIQVDIDIQVVNEISSNVKGDADYLLEVLGDSNKALSEALTKVMQFADDAKAARNTGDVKAKGWGRKLKGALDTLGSAGEQVKNISDGAEVLGSILKGIKNLARQFNLDTVLSWFS